MLIPAYKNSFKKDLELLKKRRKNMKKLYNILSELRTRIILIAVKEKQSWTRTQI
ncbi:MAG: hypothetical protein K0S27_1066 [Gammaproteobacteria bacterium]|jgi:mRNA-degrading endonuclease YafQ of YafQ-DinJ toxin-antitoxin module|nr:hypothetical protein [Gammaproteobacteria bacterium]